MGLKLIRAYKVVGARKRKVDITSTIDADSKAETIKKSSFKSAPFGMPENNSQRSALLFMGWLGHDGLPAMESISLHRVAARFTGSSALYYDCYVPDPDDEGCCMHIVVAEPDLIRAFRTKPDFLSVSEKLGVSLLQFKKWPMVEKLFYLCQHYDIIDLLRLEDIFEEIPEGVPVEEIVLEKHITEDALKITAAEDML